MRGLAGAVAATVLAVGAAGCAGPDPFAVRLSDMGYMAKMDDTYRVIPLETEADRAWFDGHLRALYDRRIDKARFVAEGDSRIPGHTPSWRRLADLFAR
jgi:hypothetical protein